jgi:hypothetical protein
LLILKGFFPPKITLPSVGFFTFRLTEIHFSGIITIMMIRKGTEMNKRKFVARDIQTIVNEFSKRTYEQSGSYSYAAGYLESMIVGLIADAPRRTQVQVLASLQSANFTLGK